MGIVKIKNISTITYRTDCFAAGSNTFHLRKTAVYQPVIYNKGTPDEFVDNVKVYYKGYNKHRDVNVRFPDASIKASEIGWDITPYNPIIADKLIIMGDYTMGDMNYSNLLFEKPAIGIPNNSDNFVLLDELHIQGSTVCGSGTKYEAGVYSSITNQALADIGRRRYIQDTSQESGYREEDVSSSTCTRFTIGTSWTWHYNNKDGDAVGDAGGFYGYGFNTFCKYNANDLATYFNASASQKVELYNKIQSDYIYGGYIYGAVAGFVNSAQWENSNKGMLNWTEGLYPHQVVHSAGYLQNIVIPFISENEMQFSKSALYQWTTAQKNAFDNAYNS